MLFLGKVRRTTLSRDYIENVKSIYTSGGQTGCGIYVHQMPHSSNNFSHQATGIFVEKKIQYIKTSSVQI